MAIHEGRFYSSMDQVIEDLHQVTNPVEARVMAMCLLKWKHLWSFDKPGAKEEF